MQLAMGEIRIQVAASCNQYHAREAESCFGLGRAKSFEFSAPATTYYSTPSQLTCTRMKRR
jgi:hypothetical protein